MDSIWMIIIFAIIAVISDKMDSKTKVNQPGKRPPVIIVSPKNKQPVKLDGELKQPPHKPKKKRIEIPELKSAPPIAKDDNVYREAEQIAVEPSVIKVPAPKKTKPVVSQVAAISKVAPEPMASKPTLNYLRQAVIWSEILGKPRAYRHFRH